MLAIDRNPFILRLRSKDRDAWRELYQLLVNDRERDQAVSILMEAYEGILKAYISRMFREYDDIMTSVIRASDVLQSGLLKIQRRLVSAKGLVVERPEAFREYLLAVFRNGAMSHIRKQLARTGREVGGDDHLATVSSSTDGPADSALWKDLNLFMRSQLPPAVVDIIDRLDAGDTFAEIGRDAGQSPDAPRKRLTRAVRPLLERIGSDPITHGRRLPNPN